MGTLKKPSWLVKKKPLFTKEELKPLGTGALTNPAHTLKKKPVKGEKK